MVGEEKREKTKKNGYVLPRVAPNGRSHRKPSDVLVIQLKRGRAPALQRFTNSICQLVGRVREGDQFGFYGISTG